VSRNDPDGPDQVHFLGVWDTVKSVGWLNWKAQLEQARWPFTARITNVATARHALAIDERRPPFKEYRFDPKAVAESNGRYQEIWFAGVHSDVGGQFADDHTLSDIAFAWMVDEAAAVGFDVDPATYHRLLKIKLGDKLPADLATGRIHHNGGSWRLLGGWRDRPIGANDSWHPSVQHRIDGTAGTASPYRPKLP
jgi:hypothetical protein